MDLQSQNEWISVSRYERRGRFVGGGEGDGERERGERGDDDGDDDDECDEAYGVTSLESRNGKDDEKRYVNGSGDDGEKPAEYDDADNGDGGDGVGDGNGVFWDEGDGEREGEREGEHGDDDDEDGEYGGTLASPRLARMVVMAWVNVNVWARMRQSAMRGSVMSRTRWSVMGRVSSTRLKALSSWLTMDLVMVWVAAPAMGDDQAQRALGRWNVGSGDKTPAERGGTGG